MSSKSLLQRQKKAFAKVAASFNHANAAFRNGSYGAALEHLGETLQRAPNLAKAHVLKARTLRQLGENKAALLAYNEALDIEPGQFDALLERGNVLRALGEHSLADNSYVSAMGARPVDPRPALALARLLEERPDRFSQERAAVAFQQALDRSEVAGHSPGSKANLFWEMGKFRLERSDLPRALESLRQARVMAGDLDHSPAIDLDIAEVYLRLGMTAEARMLMERLSNCELPSVLLTLAQLAYRFNFWEEAVAILIRRARLAPTDAQAYLDLAEMQVRSWLLEDALVSLRFAETAGCVPPTISSALRASIANRLGDSETALSLYEQLVAEGYPAFASNAAMSLLYSDSISAQEVAQRHRALFEEWGKNSRTPSSFGTDLTSTRPLRIGVVTGDLHHQHPVNIFFQPLLARWNNCDMPITVYFTGQTVDEQTRLARGRVDAWRDLTDAQLPNQIEVDKIDILLDLSGHTSSSTMRQFAKRLAPIQVSFLGYPGSTGVPNIDWLIGDSVVTPPEGDGLCSERVFRLPATVFCFSPENDYPLPDFSAVSKGRPLTFGSFNNIPKLTPKTIRLWSNVLMAVPESRLILRAPSFKDASAVDRFKQLFLAHGIDPMRLCFRGPVGLDMMMAAYSEIDIGLDPVPYCGGTTTLQALWMGVPVLTLQGEHFVSRMGSSFMMAADLSEWVAEDEISYVSKAVYFGSNRERLLGLKQGLRARLLRLPGWNADRYAIDFAKALRAIWQITVTGNLSRLE